MSRSSILVFLICARMGHAAALSAANADAAIVGDFEKRVSAYVQVRNEIESGLPALKSTRSPEKITSGQHRLADAIRGARKNARAGDIFAPPIAAEFRRLIQMTMQADGKRIEASLRHAEPVALHLEVNQSYPADIPLQSTPPTLLANLPPLPKQVEYRVAGHELILLDVKANLVADLIEAAIP